MLLFSRNHLDAHIQALSQTHTGNYIRSHSPSEASSGLAMHSHTVLCSGVSTALIPKTYLRQIHALSLPDLWSEEERQREKPCFPPTVKWIFDFDEIFLVGFATVVFCSALSRGLYWLFLEFSVKEAVFSLDGAHLLCSVIQFFFYSFYKNHCCCSCRHVKCITPGESENFTQERPARY